LVLSAAYFCFAGGSADRQQSGEVQKARKPIITTNQWLVITAFHNQFLTVPE
jgi:hypothetical protein